jgi:uncharacterized protein (TIGR02996 family)
MTDDEFLQEILAHPDDDAPRLIYADWLDERGDPRGEFIRVQCELAQLAVRNARYRKLRARERELLAQHEKAWIGSFKPLVRLWEFRRGFVEFIEVSTRDFLKRAPDIFKLMPVRRAFLRAGSRRMAALAACPYLARLSGLEFHHTSMGDDGLAALTASPHLGNLTRLKLYCCGFHEAGIHALRRPHAFQRLEHLDLGMNQIGSSGVTTLAQFPLLANVRSLRLTSTAGGDGIAALGASPFLGRLEELDLSSNQLDTGATESLAQAPQFTQLAKLRLSYCGIRDAGAAAIARSAHLTSIKELDLTGNPIGDAGLMALAQAKHLNMLTSLHIGWNGIGDQGAEALAASPLLGRFATTFLAL